MNEDQAREAIGQLLTVHQEDWKEFKRIDTAVATPTDAFLMEAYGIERGGANFSRQMDIARQSFNPVLQLVLNTYSQSLKVENYFRESEGDETAPVRSNGWGHWQRNRMDARQTGLHHAACKYGTSYASVLPATFGTDELGSSRDAVIDTFNPKRMTAVYGEAWNFEEYPILAMQHTTNGFRLFDEESVYYFGVQHAPSDPLDWLSRTYYNQDNFKFIEKRDHGVGVVPIVRYRDAWMTDGEETHGMVEPLIGIGNRINNNNFQEGVSRHFAAFKQRYIIGWSPKSEAEAFAQKASDTWWFRDDKTKVSVGQFDETDLSQYTDSRQRMEQAFAAVAQLPATVMGASAISNVSAEGLLALKQSQFSKSSELQTSLGESHEQLFRLCAHVAGDSDGASDFGAEVRWKDTGSETMAQTVDALGKMATMLGVPPEELWADIPGWTQQKVDRAKRARDASGVFDVMGDYASTLGLNSSEPEDSDGEVTV